jgi:3-hydroxyisobutyrate dehydrogenase
MKVGYIGLGKMGGGMAANILAGGYTLTVSDVSRAMAASLEKDGAIWVDTPKQVAEASDIVFTSLPGPKEVEAVALGKDGIIEGIRPGAVYIDNSSSSPTLVRKIHAAFKAKGADVMDSPVSGGPEGAAAGKLALMVGGDEAVFEKVKPVLDKIGDRITLCGGVGSGSVCKLVHNCMFISMQALAAECFTLGVKAGVDPKVLWQNLKNGAVGQGALLKRSLPATFFRGNFDQPVMALALGFKDVDLATSLARELKVPMAMANCTWSDFATAMNRGWEGRETASIMALQEERAGVEVRIPDAEIG